MLYSLDTDSVIKLLLIEIYALTNTQRGRFFV
jgi:hypothetical protein